MDVDRDVRNLGAYGFNDESDLFRAADFDDLLDQVVSELVSHDGGKDGVHSFQEGVHELRRALGLAFKQALNHAAP